MSGDQPSTSGEITQLLRRAAAGEANAFDELTGKVYAELERVAALRMRSSFGADLPGVTLEPAALVNETLLKLIEHPRDFDNRRHFYTYATKIMLRVLIDYQRRRQAEKRGGGMLRITLSGIAPGKDPTAAGAAELAETLERLAEVDARKADVVKLRVFWGLEMQEIADTLGSSIATIERDWRFARRWLAYELRRERAETDP